jgi:hypothetical protein
MARKTSASWSFPVPAESDSFEPLGLNNLITPGFGGRAYGLTDGGFIGCRHVDKANAGAACHLEGEAELQSLSRSKIAFCRSFDCSS